MVTQPSSNTPSGRSRSRRGHQAGFSLSEALMALVLMSILGTSVVHHGRHHTDTVVRSLAQLEALRAAQSELELCRTLAAAELLPGEYPFVIPAPQRSPALRDFRGIRRVRRHPDSNRLRDVEVDVRWTTDSGQLADLTLRSWIAVETQP